MKKWLLFTIITIIIPQFLMGCSASKVVEFKEFNSQAIGFTKNDEKSKLIPQDTLLMMTNKDFQRFKDKYFTLKKIPMESPDKEKAVLYLQIPSSTSSVNQYSVESINVSNDTLTVNLKQIGVAEVSTIEGVATINWVMLIELDKTNLKDNMKIVINK